MQNDDRELRIGLIGLLDEPGPNAVPSLELITQDIADFGMDASNLVFANSRRVVEWVSQRSHQLAQGRGMPYDPFLSHHGSLSKEVREHAERTLKSGKPITLFATSSLELGIDVGAVGRVSQIDAPWSISSLRQRMGRSGRRDGDPSVLRLYTRDRKPLREADLTSSLYPGMLRGIAMVELLLAGRLEPAGKPKLHLSTLVHQTLSSVRQWGAARPDRLYEILCVSGPFRNISADLYADVLRSLKAHNLIAQDSEGGIVLAETGDQITSRYEFFAAFNASEDFTVRHAENTIGLLPAAELPKSGQHIILNGRRWRVEAIRYKQKTVEVAPAEAGSVPTFGGDIGDVHTIVFEEMRRVLTDSAVPCYLDPNASRLLEAARLAARNAGLIARKVVPGHEVLLWYPWIGTRALRTLRLCAKLEKLECGEDGLCLAYKGVSTEQFISHIQKVLSGELDPVRAASLMEQKRVQKFDEFLSDKLLDLANANDRLDYETAQLASREALDELMSVSETIQPLVFSQFAAATL